jgi:hypothetical protein
VSLPFNADSLKPNRRRARLGPQSPGRVGGGTFPVINVETGGTIQVRKRLRHDGSVYLADNNGARYEIVKAGKVRPA